MKIFIAGASGAIGSKLVPQLVAGGPSRPHRGDRRGAWIPRAERRRQVHTIRVLLGLLRADSGRAEVLGGDRWHGAVALHRRMAYVPGDVELCPNLTGGEAIDLLAGSEVASTRPGPS